MSWAKGKAPTLASQAILLMLGNYADEWGVTYIGQESLADDLSCRKATISDNLAKLEGQQLIGRVRRHDAKGRRTSDHVVLAPLAADRGAMRDADKRAYEKHPEEVCALARRQGTPSVSGSERAPDTPDGEPRYASPLGLDTPAVPEPSEEPSERTGTEEKPPTSPVQKVELPDDFPEHLRPHLIAVYKRLRDLAKRHNAKAINPLALAQIVMTRPHKTLVEAAGDFASWADDQHEPRKDVLAGYRNWLKKCSDLAGFEQLDAEGNPHTTPGPRRESGNVVHLRRPDSVQRANAWNEFYSKDGAREGMR